ncbi:Protein CLP1-like protein, partial [Fragariocoptes setiger]
MVTDDKMDVYDLSEGQELRFQVRDEPIEIELRRGTAEIFGTEMMLGRRYRFTKGTRLAAFTYQSATIEVFGTSDVMYVGLENPNYFYLNIHGLMEAMKCPVCLVCGPADVGKSTLCRILLSYAARKGRSPIFVDLDPGQGQIGIPGSIGALVVEHPVDIEEDYALSSSLVMHYGHISPSVDNNTKNTLLYETVIASMAKIVARKLVEDPKSAESGVVINTCGWIKGSGYSVLLKACEAFKVDYVLVFEEDLQNRLSRDLKSTETKVILTPKSGGVAFKQREEKVESRNNRIRQYFYGRPNERFYPAVFDVKFSSLKNSIYRVGVPSLMLPDSLMPLGARATDSQLKVVPVELNSANLLHHILAISFAKVEDVLNETKIVLETNVMGFICVTDVNEKEETVTILSPQPRPLPAGHALLLSSVQYMDSH